MPITVLRTVAGTARAAVMGNAKRAPSESELDALRAIVREGRDAGAIGFSTGLYYKPSEAAPTEEVVSLAKIAHKHDAMYVTHMRNENDRVMTALDETFAIGREAELPVVVSHHKVIGRKNFGRSAETLPFIDQRAARPYRSGDDLAPRHLR